MYLCPVCNDPFETEKDVVKHSLKCWREHNPNHQPKPVPRSEYTKEEVTNEVLDFFASLQRRN